MVNKCWIFDQPETTIDLKKFKGLMLKIQKYFSPIATAGVIVTLITGCEFDNEICSPDDGSGVKITPSSVFLEADETNLIEFTASGGQYAYTWHMSSNTLGTLYFATTNTAVALYQSTTNTGTNMLTVQDADNNGATARIVQR